MTSTLMRMRNQSGAATWVRAVWCAGIAMLGACSASDRTRVADDNIVSSGQQKVGDREAVFNEAIKRLVDELEACPVVEKTPYDNDVVARWQYIVGYQLARTSHQVCGRGRRA